MDAAYYDLAYGRGETCALAFRLKQSDGQPIDLTSSEIRATFQRGVWDLVKTTKDGTITVDDALDGRVSFQLSETETDWLAVNGRSRWKLERVVTGVDGKISQKETLIEGRQIVSGEGFADG